jgi:AcrR family transcriptional regulator
LGTVTDSFIAPRRDNGSTPDSDTYRTLLRAAREVIRERGYNRATVEDIRRAAGVSRATFYFYFQDKRQVLVRLLSETTQQYIVLYKKRYSYTDDYSRIVLTHIEYFAHFARDSDIMIAAGSVASHDPAFREKVEEVRRGFRQRVERRIARLIANGTIPATNIEMLALILIGMVEHFTDEFFRRNTTDELVRANIAEAIRVLSETWYRALFVQEPPKAFPYEDFLREVDFHGPA